MTYTQRKIDSTREFLNELGYILFHGFEDESVDPRYREEAIAAFGKMIAFNYEARKRQEEVYKRCPYLRTL